MYIAIDIGGTKTQIGIFKDKEFDSEIYGNIFPTNQSYSKALLKIVNEISENISDVKEISKIVVSFPGEISPEGEIIQASNIPNYKGRPMKKTLEDIFGVEVLILQDASCSAISEVLYGSTSQYNKIVHIILGTGVGGSVIERKPLQKVPIQVDQTIISPFEPWGMVIDTVEPKRHKMAEFDGILEAYIGGGNIADHDHIDMNKLSDNDKFWDIYTDYLAIGLNNINTVLKPEVIVLDGGIGQKRSMALAQVEAKLEKYDDFMKYTPKIFFSQVKGNTSLLGALAVNFVDHLVINS